MLYGRCSFLNVTNVSLCVRVPCFNEISSGDVRDTVLKLKFSLKLVEVFNVKVLYINYSSCKVESRVDCGNTGNVVLFFQSQDFLRLIFVCYLNSEGSSLLRGNLLWSRSSKSMYVSY